MPEEIEYITKNVVLDKETKAIVDQLVADRRFSNQGFSLAVRTIIWEWDAARKAGQINAPNHTPATQPVSA